MLFPETTERSNRGTFHLMTGKIGMLFTAAVLLAGGCATNSLERSLPGEEGVDPAAVPGVRRKPRTENDAVGRHAERRPECVHVAEERQGHRGRRLGSLPAGCAAARVFHEQELYVDRRRLCGSGEAPDAGGPRHQLLPGQAAAADFRASRRDACARPADHAVGPQERPDRENVRGEGPCAGIPRQRNRIQARHPFRL